VYALAEYHESECALAGEWHTAEKSPRKSEKECMLAE
jgi:hypothetical protein